MTNLCSTRVLVTGASGFIGRSVCRRLVGQGFAVRACVHRGKDPALFEDAQGPIEIACRGDIAENPDWEGPLDGVDTVVHLAARVHFTSDPAADPLAECRRINVSATERLAQAASGRARRFVFVSSIGVNGNRTLEKPFDETDPPHPHSPYAVSKWEAEKALGAIARRSGMEVVIVRPPLVYGPGVPANFLRLMDLVYRGLPLPLPYQLNRRSLIGVENLADLLVRCVSHPAAAHQTFLASDGEDVSTYELVKRLAHAFRRPCRYLRLPGWSLRCAAAMAGKREEAGRLIESLAVNCAKARELLDWSPPVSLAEGLTATARWYADTRAQRN